MVLFKKEVTLRKPRQLRPLETFCLSLTYIFGRFAALADIALDRLCIAKAVSIIYDNAGIGKQKYITSDVDSHNGGIWKMANSIKDLGLRKTRLGTYDMSLKRIGD